MDNIDNMDELIEILIDYYVDTGWCKNEKEALSKIDFDEIEKFLQGHDIIRNVKEEVLDLIDMAIGVYGPRTEVSKDGVIVNRNNKKWKIEIVI